MAIDLLTLIKAAPFPEESRQKLMANFAKFSQEQKTKLANLCWFSLTQQFQNELQYEQGKLKLEINEGKKKFYQADFEEVEKKLTREFTAKLKGAETEEDIEEVREELQKQLQKPLEFNPKPKI